MIIDTVQNSASHHFPTEIIGENQKLFYRIHKINIDPSISDKKEKIMPVAFDPQPREKQSVQMSVNWEKYSTAENTRSKARKPELNGVVSFLSTRVRQTPVSLNVTHDPTQKINQAHTIIHDILSEKNDPQIRLLLRECCKWEIEI